jgi:hypothetical protein
VILCRESGVDGLVGFADAVTTAFQLLPVTLPGDTAW